MQRERMLGLLGLAADAPVEAVKRRYRELARRYHPDVCPGDDRAHARFRAILAAYQELVAPAASQAPRAPAMPDPGPAASQEIAVARAFVVPLRRDARTRAVPVEITLEQVMRGAQLGVALPDGRIALVDVPPGADTGLLLRPEAELLVEIRVLPHRVFRRRGDDLLVCVPIGVEEAFAGTTLRLATLTGEVAVVVPRYSRRGDVIRLVGRGVPGPRGRGDLFVELTS